MLRALETRRRACPAPRAVLTAATFRDGSHEGDDRSAARLLGWQIGAITQYRLVAPYDRPHRRADPTLNDDQRIALIKEAIFRLATETDTATIRAFRSRFRNCQQKQLTGDLNFGLVMAREQIWWWFYPYEDARSDASHKRTPPSVRKLWEEAPKQQ